MALRIRPEDLPKELTRRARSTKRAIYDGMREGAELGRVAMVRRTPRVTGQLANAWEVRGKRTVVLQNTAPYSDVVETGARPHPVSFEGRVAIARWARLKLGLNPGEAQALAEGYAKKLMRKGQAPTYFVRDSLDDLTRYLSEAVVRHIRKQAVRRAIDKPMPPGGDD